MTSFLSRIFLMVVLFLNLSFALSWADTSASSNPSSTESATSATTSDPQNTLKSTPFERPRISSEMHRAIGTIAVQANGRVKPLDTLAREGISLVTGKSSYRGLSGVEFMLSLLAEPRAWENERFIQIRHLALKKDIGLVVDGGDEKQSMFTYREIVKNEALGPLFSELSRKQTAKEKLDPYFQAVQRISNQLGFISMVISGRSFRMIPPPDGNTWIALDKFNRDHQLLFTLLLATFVNPKSETHARATIHARKFKEEARQVNPALYPADSKLQLEYNFNKYRPFRWAWVVALFAAVCFAFSLSYKSPVLYWSAISVGLVSFLLQVIGFTMRCLIAGRPPVTNMYESVIWVAAGTLFFGLLFELKHRNRLYGLGSMIFTFLCLLIADNIGSIMDDGIHPLEPVLRSNFWLTVHVLTITLSYAAFSLSLILANLAVFPYLLFGKESSTFNAKDMARSAYRSIQIGVILLAAGTILGGVWADYSWGRFWGWDPKETWALIALLGYLALLHARFRGMVKAFGFLSWSIVAYMGVLMAWYGVNFVLGAGLHSYGFSTGGLSGVATYVAVQLAILVIAWIRLRKGKSIGSQAN